MSSGPQLRIGHRERESACRALDEHLTEGRLDMDEYADRYAKATLARFRDDLVDLFVDLPPPHPALPSRYTPPVTAEPEPRPLLNHRQVLVALRMAAIVLLVFVAIPVLAAWWMFWIVVPLVFCGPHRLRRARRGGWPAQSWQRPSAIPPRL